MHKSLTSGSTAQEQDSSSTDSLEGKALVEHSTFQAQAAKVNQIVQLHNQQFAEVYQRGDFVEAIRICDEIIKLKPDSLKACGNKGNALAELGRYEEAIIAYDQALSLKPDSLKAFYNKGGTLAELGRHEEAILAYDQALCIKPDDHIFSYWQSGSLKQSFPL